MNPWKCFLLLGDRYGRMQVVQYNKVVEEWIVFQGHSAERGGGRWNAFPQELFPDAAILVPLPSPLSYELAVTS